MDSPRHRRRRPQRTGPLRNTGGVFRDDYDSARTRDDAASRGVREGYQVIDEQIRRGHRMAQTMCEENGYGYGYATSRERSRRPRYPEEGHREGRRGHNLLEMPMRHIECLAQEILHQIGSGRPDPLGLAELVLQLQLEAISELACLGFGALGRYPRHGHHHHGHHHHDHYHDDHYHDDHYHDDHHYGDDHDRYHDHYPYYPGDTLCDDVASVERDIDDSLDRIQEEIREREREDQPWDWPAAPSSPTTIRSTVPIPVFVSAHDRTEIGLDLPAGSQSLDLEIEPPPPEPAFEADFVTLADGPAILRIEVPRDLPAGRYRRRILVRATGEPVGDLTVQLGAVPKTRPKARKP